ncbi:MAG: hypothetical protein ACXWIN_10630, partial [Burkholderiaceae bacterium]
MKIPGTNTHIYIGKNPDSDLTTEQKNRPELGPGPTNWKPLSVYVGSKSMQNTLNKLMEWKQVGKGRFEKTTILGDGTKWTSFKHDSAITKTSNWKNNQNGTFTRKHIDKDEREWSQSIDAFDNIGMFTRTQLDESGRKWSYSMNNFGDITKTSNWMKNQDGTTRKHIDKDEREWSKSMSASRETGMFTRTEVDESGRKWSYSMNASGEITSTTGWEKQDDDTYARTIIRPGGILIDESITEAVYLRKTEQEAEALANDNEMNAAISIQHKYRARKKREQLVVNNYGYIAVTDENKNVLCYTKPNVGHKPGERLTKQILPLPPQVDYVDSLSGSMKFVSHCDDPATLPKLNTDKYAVKPNTTRKLYLGLTFR